MSRNNCVDKKKLKKEKNTGVAIFLLTDWAILKLFPKKKQYDHKLALKYVNSWKLNATQKTNIKPICQ